MTVLGGGGAWPAADRGCSGCLVEHAGYRLLVDPGYATISATFAPPASQVDAVVLDLDSDMHLDQDCELREFDPDTTTGALRIGPFTVHPMRLAHFVDNVGVRIEVDDSALAYTGDGGADPAVAELADVPGTDPAASLRAARGEYDGPVGVAEPGLSIDISG